MEVRGLFFLIYLLVGFVHSQADKRMEKQFEMCCNLGTSWASEGLRCEKFVGPVSGVPQEQQGLCLEAVDICCIKTYHEKNCEKGKQYARQGLACAESTKARREIDDYQRDCCEGCKLGLLTGYLGQGCAFKSFSFGKPWDPAFLECCHEIISTTTAEVTETSFTASPGNASTVPATKDASDSTSSSNSLLASSSATSDGIPTPEMDDICQLLKGLLCSDICVPTPGSYRCECPEGWVLLEDQKTCRSDGPIDRCQSNNLCEHKCIDTGMAVKCECNPGFTLADDGHSCSSSTATTDATKPYPTETTQQTKPSMKCPLGYRYNPTVRVCDDIDECENEPCKSEKCHNTIGSYICGDTIPSSGSNGREKAGGIEQDTCPPGYQWDIQLQSCEDIDECTELASVPCPNETHFCINTQGSFACHELLAPKACPAGFKFDITAQLCRDVDECSEGLHGCLPEVEVCRNTEGAYECDVQCKKGFTFSQSTGICIDIDECAEKNPCPKNKPRCINGPGGYKCAKAKQSSRNNRADQINANEITHESIKKDNDYLIPLENQSPPQAQRLPVTPKRPCAPGYRFDGEKCADVDECREGPGCQDHEKCSNRLGGYDCRPLCQTGWYFDRISKTCQDVDECLLGHHNCQQDTQFCQNTNGSFICIEMPSCSPGFRTSQNGSCVDIDECTDKLHNCSPLYHQYCVNNQGGFDCVTRLPDCENGYKYSLNSRSCEDIDECSDPNNSPCDRRLQERCVNLKGSFRCERPVGTTDSYRRRPACPSGYRYDTFGRQCQDIDECREKIDICGNEVCYNQPGGYSCARAPSPVTTRPVRQEQLPTSGPTQCGTGLRYVRNRGCSDIDECREIEDVCTSNEECANTVGSYVCNCRMGFRRDNLTQACVDINECQLDNDCLPTQRCDNTLGSYNCVRFLPCGTGYTLNAATELCEDDDECVMGTHDCSDGYHCRNTLGSYRCDRNQRGSTSTTRSTPQPTSRRPTAPLTPAITQMLTTMMTPVIGSRNQPERMCPPGFQREASGQCVDIDECSLGASNPCIRSPLQRCINTMGSYRCTSHIICGAGYTLDPRSSRCTDVDECANGTHQCTRGQTCENRPGGYVCICPPGHTLGPNQDCVDIDECSIYSRNICGTTGKCENTVGSYRCICEEGFEKRNDGGCEDIDECERTPGICQHQCVNVWGSYRCICQSGYTLNHDNRSCSDVDECQVYKNNNLCVGICDNTPGSYSCRCPEGYRLGEDRRTCQDIDECTAGPVCRDPNEMCQNTRGGYRCNRIQCPRGYHRDQDRKNRCVRSSRYCPPGDVACYQSPSHYSFNFITFVSFLPIPRIGQLELFTMRGTHLPGSIVRFSMALVDARAPPGVNRATESCFALRRPSPSQAVLVLTRSLQGPQEIELDLSMEIYHDSAFAGSAVAKLFIYVTQYEF